MRRQVVGVSTALLVLLAGCSSVGTSSGSSVSPCFRVLPQAHAAVRHQGVFIGVNRLRGRRAASFPRPQATGPSVTSTTVPAAVPGDSRPDICVVAYRGTFDPIQIDHLEGPLRTGSYAVVVLGIRSQRVRYVFLTDRLPGPLRRH
jgi:hypothetical protein